MKKKLSIFLALLILLSNVGFSLNAHYCGGQLVESTISIGIRVSNCGMDAGLQTCESGMASQKESMMPCCENQHQILQLEDDLELQSASIHIQPTFVISFVHSFLQPFLLKESSSVPKEIYPPPFPDEDLQALFQSFLI